jgi:hypothetical protein
MNDGCDGRAVATIAFSRSPAFALQQGALALIALAFSHAGIDDGGVASAAGLGADARFPSPGDLP